MIIAIQEHLAPCLNRFVIFLHQKATAKIKLTCKDGKVNVNINHELGEVEEITPSIIPNKSTVEEFEDL